MKAHALGLAATLLLVLVGDHAILAQNPACPPERDPKNPNLERAKEAKKAELRKAGYPERFMKLIDLEKCIECVRIASDAFHIMIVYKDNDYAPKDPKTGRRWTHISAKWDPGSELIAREKTKDGTIKGYYIYNTLSEDCVCCPEMESGRTARDRSDWNEDLGANTGHLIPFDQSNTTGPTPEDLIEPHERWLNDPVPDIDRFQKPAFTQVTAPCPQCAADAQQLNAAYRDLDLLWEQKVSLMNEMSELDNRIATRGNEISLLYYKQRYALTRLPDGDKQIADAERAQDADMAKARQDVLDLDDVEADIAALTPKIAALEKALGACVEKCKTTTVTETASRPAVTEATPSPTTPTTAPSPRTTPMVSVAPATTNATAPTTAPPPRETSPTCARCQGLADALRAFERRRGELQTDIEKAEQELAILPESIAKTYEDLKTAKGDAAVALDYQATKWRARLRTLPDEIGTMKREAESIDEQIAALRQRLSDCNLTCGVAESLITEPWNPIAGAENVTPACAACRGLAAAFAALLLQEQNDRATIEKLQRESDALGRDEQRLREAQKTVDPRSIAAIELREQADAASMRILRINESKSAIESRLKDAKKNEEIYESQLAACNASCKTVTETATAPDPERPTECFGDSCRTEWSACTATDSCKPVTDDCGIPGTCYGEWPGSENLPLVNMTDGAAWTISFNIEIDTRVQDKLADLLDPALFPKYSQPFPLTYAPVTQEPRNATASYLVIDPIEPERAQDWFNPLGLLVRSLRGYVDRWRASMGPRPMIRASDLALIDNVSNVQAAGLPKGVHVLMTDQGGSTGRTLAVQILNLSGRKVRLSPKPFAVQPVKQQAQQQVVQAFNRLAKAAPVRLDLNAYCVEFLKLPPGPSTLLRLAPQNVQQKYAPMSKILQSAYRVAKGNGLHPDSNPAAYTDAIKQWALWTVEQNLNEARFTDAFLGHTKKNVEAVKQQWSKQAEDMIRKASPNRWRDIVRILQGAGVPVPK